MQALAAPLDGAHCLCLRTCSSAAQAQKSVRFKSVHAFYRRVFRDYHTSCSHQRIALCRRLQCLPMKLTPAQSCLRACFFLLLISRRKRSMGRPCIRRRRMRAAKYQKRSFKTGGVCSDLYVWAAESVDMRPYSVTRGQQHVALTPKLASDHKTVPRKWPQVLRLTLTQWGQHLATHPARIRHALLWPI